MEIPIPYGEEKLTLRIPDLNLLGVVKPASLSPAENINVQKEKIVKELKEFLAKAHTVLVIVNDYTRPTPNSDILKLIEEELKEHDVQFIVASGSHRAPNEKEFKQIFGNFYESYKDKIVVHNARDNVSLFFLGKTSLGIPVWLNKAILWADKIVTINSVEPHYFAGFTGGRKSFIPGIAGLETITKNHKLVLNPKAITLNLKGNPIHEDMTEIVKMVPKEIFSIQIALDADHKIFSLKFGDIFKSFYDSIEDAKKIFCVPIKGKTDIVVTVVQHPYDVNFYQSQKAMENAKLALKDQGIIIAVSKCFQGVGEDDFVRFLSSYPSPAQALKHIENDFKIGYQKVVRLSLLLSSSEVWTVMGIEDKTVQSVFMTPFHDINLALQKALEKKGASAKVLVLLDGSLTVPLTN
jgi:nickel-dependent lactate racemase